MNRALKQIETANKNLRQIERLKKPKPNLQAPGNLARKVGSGKKRHQFGGATVRDKWGAYLYVPK